MALPMPTRVRLAFFISPLTVVPILALSGVVMALGHDEPLRDMPILAAEGALVAAFWGLPVAYIITLLVGLPAYHLLRAWRAFRPAPICTIGAVAGALTMSSLGILMSRSPPEWGPALGGALLGSLSAGVFVLVARPHLSRANTADAI